MRLLIFISIFIPSLISVSAFAQTGKSDRNAISLIQISYNDHYTTDLNQLFTRMQLEDRYDINDIPTKQIHVKEERIHINQNEEREALDRTQQLTQYLNERNIGLEIISYLFNRDTKSGQMDTERLHKRGAYNASDENVLESMATKRGVNEIYDAGFKLINNSYIFIFDFTNIQYKYEKESSNDEGDYYWSMTPAAYLFKIEWDENLQNQLFDCWIDTDTPEKEINDKKRAFEHIYVPVKFLSREVKYSCRVSTGIEEQNRKVAKGKKRKYSNQQLKDNAFVNMVFNAADYLGEELVNQHESFQISNFLYATHPLRAKIGKKESVNVNDLYYVYENVLQADGNTKPIRKGVVRATKYITDNRIIATGNSGTTEFYQIAGGKLEEGMTLKEKRNFCASFDLGYRYGELEGVYAGFSLFLYGSRVMNHNFMLEATVWKNAATVSLDYGFGPRCNNFDIFPYIGIGLDNFFTNEEEQELGLKENLAWIAKGGLRFNLNIYYPVQLFGAAEYDYLFDQNEEYKQLSSIKNRNIQGFNVYGGLRVCF